MKKKAPNNKASRRRDKGRNIKLDILVLRFSRATWELLGLSRCCNDCIMKLQASGFFTRVTYSLGGTDGFVREKLLEMPLIRISRGYQGIIEHRQEQRRQAKKQQRHQPSNSARSQSDSERLSDSDSSSISRIVSRSSSPHR